MTYPSTLISHAEIIRTAAVLDASAPRIERADLTVTVEFCPTELDAPSRADSAGQDCRDWIDRYVRDRDLGAVFDFAPTPRLLAVYLLRAFMQLSPEVLAVTVEQGGTERARATLAAS